MGPIGDSQDLMQQLAQLVGGIALNPRVVVVVHILREHLQEQLDGFQDPAHADLQDALEHVGGGGNQPAAVQHHFLKYYALLRSVKD